MRFEFIHCHGSGNDFPLIDARGLALAGDQWAVVARALADRSGPVGGDGLLLLTEGDADHAFGMVMRNSDGGEAEQCLNGLRCVARAGFAALGIDRARVKLKISSAEAWIEPPLAAGVVTIGERAGPADLDVTRWPMRGGRERIVEEPVPELGTDLRFTAVAMPNPHLVAFVETADDAELSRLGTLCEGAPRWLPNRANVSFVEVRGPETLFVRTFERGVGLTESCGSAMAASVYAACLTGHMDWNAKLTVLNRGGLVRGSASENAMVTLAGNTTWEWRGTVEVDLASGAASGLDVAERFGEEIDAWNAARGAAPPP